MMNEFNMSTGETYAALHFEYVSTDDNINPDVTDNTINKDGYSSYGHSFQFKYLSNEEVETTNPFGNYISTDSAVFIITSEPIDFKVKDRIIIIDENTTNEIVQLEDGRYQAVVSGASNRITNIGIVKNNATINLGGSTEMRTPAKYLTKIIRIS